MKEVRDRQDDEDEFRNLEINYRRPSRHRPSRHGFNEMFNGFPDFNSFKIWCMYSMYVVCIYNIWLKYPVEILDFIFQQMNVLVNSGNKYKNICRALKNIENSYYKV